MSNAFLSVVIPTFNRKSSLQKTLDGLARQTYPAAHFEVIVVSDGSTDGTAGGADGLCPGSAVLPAGYPPGKRRPGPRPQQRH